jgi:transglutaminase-like putative cysteine protease
VAWKTQSEGSEGLNETTYRTTRDVALAKNDDKPFDLGFDPIVRIARPLAEPWKTKRVRYRIELEGSDPAQLFRTGPYQQVTSIGPHAVELVASAPGTTLTGKAAPSEQPKPQESAPSSMVQSADPTIVDMARQARGAKTDPLAVAYALEKYVFDTIGKKDLSQAFASALEVARSKQGDCTEHAVLLAALARASGLPSRVAIGLIYMPKQQGFGYHMWTQVFVGNRWLPLDATLGRGGIGASHLQLGTMDLADSDVEGQSAFASLLTVMRVLGRLKIEVLAAE